MKIEDLKVGRVYRAKRPRVVHTLGGSYINDRQILSISPFEENIQYDSPIDRIHQQILCAPRVENHKHSKR